MNDDLARLRCEAGIRPGFQESSAAMFPAPRRQWVDAASSCGDEVRAVPHETLAVHGCEDLVIPPTNSLTPAHWISRAQLSLVGRCGDWTQIDCAARFARPVSNFLTEPEKA